MLSDKQLVECFAQTVGTDMTDYMRRVGRAIEAAALADLRALIADDAYAATFQSFGQYRSALLKAINAKGAVQ